MSTNEPMTPEQLDAIQERVDGATKGPWGCYGDGAHEVFDAREYDDGELGEIVAPVVTKLSDAHFIAHARTDVPALLAEVDRLRERLTVDDAMVERAARALYLREISWSSEAKWDRLPDPVKRMWRLKAEAVLDAAHGTGEGA